MVPVAFSSLQPRNIVQDLKVGQKAKPSISGHDALRRPTAKAQSLLYTAVDGISGTHDHGSFDTALQSLQYPFIKEYTLNLIRDPLIIKGLFLC